MNIDRIIGLSAWLATLGFIAAIIAVCSAELYRGSPALRPCHRQAGAFVGRAA